MNMRDPKLTALLFNEAINARDLPALSDLMSEDHTFIDREDTSCQGRKEMTEGWGRFFAEFPEYRNTFQRVESREDRVVILGYAEWTVGGEPDHVIWTGRIHDDRVSEWRVYVDTPENRLTLGLQ